MGTYNDVSVQPLANAQYENVQPSSVQMAKHEVATIG